MRARFRSVTKPKKPAKGVKPAKKAEAAKKAKPAAKRDSGAEHFCRPYKTPDPIGQDRMPPRGAKPRFISGTRSKTRARFFIGGDKSRAGIEEFYAALRDKFDPGKPLWLTETADAACGGNPWASTFLDSFRYLDQLGRLAKRGVVVVMHNTLASSDYGLLDENSFAPRSNYWAALLWRKLMGTAVLNPGASSSPGLNLYAHSLRGVPGGVALLAINASNDAQSLQIATFA